MENMIIILILIVLVLIGLRATLKHFKGEGGCCGGKSAPPPVPEKKLEHVIGQKTIRINGMTCDHCKAWVERSLNELDGVSAKVNLKKGAAVVSCDREISDEQLRSAVEKVGYQVVEIR